MRITSETVADGIREQLFTIGDIPGVLWTPAEDAHQEVPSFGIDSSVRFFARHLGTTSSS